MAKNFVVSPLSQKHLASAYFLAKQQFGEHCWTEKQFAEEAENTNRKNLVLVDTESNEVVCFLIVLEEEIDREILYLATRETEKKKGLASLLLNEIFSDKKNIFLEVKEENYPAISFYKKHGFVEFSRRKKYYPDGTDAILMKRSF